jgi:hypothetical protein
MSTNEPAVVVVVVPLVDHLTEPALRAALSPTVALLGVGGPRLLLLVDCRRMTGYDADARALFVSWNTAHRHRIDRVAIVTDNRLWHMVIAAMSLATRQEMRPFPDPVNARMWLEQHMLKAS